MADYYGTGRSNYFAVKDEQAFLDEMSNLDVSIGRKQSENGETLFALFGDENSDGCLPWYERDSEDEFVELDWEDVFARHLKDDWVAVLLEVGAEKYRFLNAFAYAYNNKREVRCIDIADIYTLALEIGSNVEESTY